MSILEFPRDIAFKKTEVIVSEIKILLDQLKQKPISPIDRQQIFHNQTLKSSLFSARIEGNNLTLAQAKTINFNGNKEKSNLEISNIIKTINNINKLPATISTQVISSIHKQIMNKIDTSAGKFRQESSAIFDGNGTIVYLTPEPDQVRQMMTILVKQINISQTTLSQLPKIAQCHYYFEKIHPFLDGNGRVGRALLQYQLQQTNLFYSYILPIDEYFEKNRADYYFHLEKNSRNIDEFIIFFLEGIVYSLKQLLNSIDDLTQTNLTKASSLNKNGKNLLPRRQELINIINDHPYISMDSLSRRFPTIPKRTIAYDINWLVKHELVTKHGETRGVRYSV
ncbi:MAG: Fic family protein [Candidatus Pacebacteria bacterium]|nr:Fic family protein [Candidatus Paceibacterota bacterium]